MNKTRFFTLLLTLLLVLSFSLVVSASAEMGEERTEGITVQGNGEVITWEASSVYIPGEDTPGVEEETAAIAAPSSRSGNTPFFIGAVLAVLLFVSVAVYCKVHGNKSL